MKSLTRFSALVLAGGRSRRMGRDKARLEWQGRPLWRVQVDKLRALQPERLMIACRQEQGLHDDRDAAGEVEWIFDPPGEDCGPIAAIARGLELAGAPLLVLPVDAPLATAAWLRESFLSFDSGGRGLFFEGDHGYEPLIALYVPAMLPLLQAAFQQGDYSLQRVVEAAIQRGVAVPKPPSLADTAILRPANTPEEWEGQMERQV